MSNFGDDESGGTSDDPGGRRRRRDRPAKVHAPRQKRPIDAAQLQELAVGYAARYATTAARLQRYLDRKLNERVWTADDAPDIGALVARITALGYVDDRAYAAAKVRDLTARGFGSRRVRGALAAAGVGRDDVAGALAGPDDAEDRDTAALASARHFARRRRFGPYANDPALSRDPARHRREMAAMARAGHDFGVARQVLAAGDADDAEDGCEDGGDLA